MKISDSQQAANPGSPGKLQLKLCLCVFLHIALLARTLKQTVDSAVYVILPKKANTSCRETGVVQLLTYFFLLKR